MTVSVFAPHLLCHNIPIPLQNAIFLSHFEVSHHDGVLIRIYREWWSAVISHFHWRAVYIWYRWYEYGMVFCKFISWY